MRSHDEARALFNDHTNLAFIVARVNAWQLRGRTDTDLDDATQICLMELWRCCRVYTEQPGATFATYATACMKGKIDQLKRTDIRRRGVCSFVSLDADLDARPDHAPEAPDDTETQALDGVTVELFLQQLDARTRVVVQGISQGYSQPEVAASIGVTQARVCQMYKNSTRDFARKMNRA